MRRYDDLVDVRRGQVAGGAGPTTPPVEGPEQFLWRGRLWKVSAVVAHWVETGAWWKSEDAPADLAAEREVWRVEAARGMASTGAGPGVFDLVFDWADGSWRLARCLD